MTFSSEMAAKGAGLRDARGGQWQVRTRTDPPRRFTGFEGIAMARDNEHRGAIAGLGIGKPVSPSSREGITQSRDRFFGKGEIGRCVDAGHGVHRLIDGNRGDDLAPFKEAQLLQPLEPLVSA